MAAVLVEDDVAEADEVALRVDVHLADGVGLVAGVPVDLGKRRQVGPTQRLVEDTVAVGRRESARVQLASGRNTGRRRAVRVGEDDAAVPKRVEGRREDDGIVEGGVRASRPAVHTD